MSLYKKLLLIIAILYIPAALSALIKNYRIEYMPHESDKAPKNITHIDYDKNFVYCLDNYRLYRFYKDEYIWDQPFNEPIEAFDVDGRYIYTEKWIYNKKLKERYPVKTDFYKTYQGTTCVVSDDNFIWVGSEDGGLSCYDRSKDTAINFYEHPFSVSGKKIGGCDISAVYPTKEKVWVGRWDGLSVYDRGNKTWKNYLRCDWIDALAVRDDKVWLGIRNKGLYLFEPQLKDKSLQKIKHFTSEYPTKILLEGQEIYASGEYFGLLNINTQTNDFTIITDDEISKKAKVEIKSIRTFCKDGKILWLGTYNGLVKLRICYPLSSNP
ncbi:MAG: hypothetical protein AB1765_07995 [Candidatus Hydrogenedentota bacterium]